MPRIDALCGMWRSEMHDVTISRLITAQGTGADQNEAEDAGSLRELINNIVAQHHEYLKGELPALEASLVENSRIGSEKFRQITAAMLPLLVRFRQELERHMQREELNLFPLIERLERAVAAGQAAPHNSFGPLSNAIQFMNEDHDFEDKLLDKMAEMSEGFAAPPDAPAGYAKLMTRLQTLRLDLDEHVRKEDKILFPATIRLEEKSK